MVASGRQVLAISQVGPAGLGGPQGVTDRTFYEMACRWALSCASARDRRNGGVDCPCAGYRRGPVAACNGVVGTVLALALRMDGDDGVGATAAPVGLSSKRARRRNRRVFRLLDGPRFMQPRATSGLPGLRSVLLPSGVIVLASGNPSCRRACRSWSPFRSQWRLSKGCSSDGCRQWTDLSTARETPAAGAAQAATQEEPVSRRRPQPRIPVPGHDGPPEPGRAGPWLLHVVEGQGPGVDGHADDRVDAGGVEGV